jgi:integrase
MTTAALVKGREARAALPAPLTLAAGQSHTAETILRAWFDGKADHTIRSYRHDLEDFALYLSRALGISSVLKATDALTRLFGLSAPAAHETVLGFRTWMQSAHLSPGTINRHLATLRSLSKLARMLGFVEGGWFLEVPNVKAEKRRDTRGPTIDEVRRMLEATSGSSEAETRDAAMILLLYCCGLRVSELCALNYEDLDLDHRTAWIKGKGRREKSLIPLPAAVVAAIRRYLPHRGTVNQGPQQGRPLNGALFVTRKGRPATAGDHRLQTRSVLRIVRTLGQRIGIHVWCHGLRHASITAAIEEGQRAGIGLEQVRAFSRHQALATMLLYRDERDREQVQKRLTDLVADTLTE